MDLLTYGKIQKQVIAAVFLDIQKVSDKAYIHDCIYKLIKYSFQKYLTDLIYSYLQDRNFHVNDSLSHKYLM